MSDVILEGAFTVLAVVGAGGVLSHGGGFLKNVKIFKKVPFLKDVKFLSNVTPESDIAEEMVGKNNLSRGLVDSAYEAVTEVVHRGGEHALSEASAAAPTSSFWTAIGDRSATVTQPIDGPGGGTEGSYGLGESPLVQIQRSQLRLVA